MSGRDFERPWDRLPIWLRAVLFVAWILVTLGVPLWAWISSNPWL